MAPAGPRQARPVRELRAPPLLCLLLRCTCIDLPMGSFF
jgi:hypothetical protein